MKCRGIILSVVALVLSCFVNAVYADKNITAWGFDPTLTIIIPYTDVPIDPDYKPFVISEEIVDSFVLQADLHLIDPDIGWGGSGSYRGMFTATAPIAVPDFTFEGKNYAVFKSNHENLGFIITVKDGILNPVNIQSNEEANILTNSGGWSSSALKTIGTHYAARMVYLPSRVAQNTPIIMNGTVTIGQGRLLKEQSKTRISFQNHCYGRLL